MQIMKMSYVTAFYLKYIYDAVHWIKLDINLLQFCGLNIVVWIVRNILILVSKS